MKACDCSSGIFTRALGAFAADFALADDPLTTRPRAAGPRARAAAKYAKIHTQTTVYLDHGLDHVQLLGTVQTRFRWTRPLQQIGRTAQSAHPPARNTSTCGALFGRLLVSLKTSQHSGDLSVVAGVGARGFVDGRCYRRVQARPLAGACTGRQNRAQ